MFIVAAIAWRSRQSRSLSRALTLVPPSFYPRPEHFRGAGTVAGITAKLGETSETLIK